MANVRMSLKVRHFALAGLCAATAASLPAAAARSRIQWVSVYGGNETSFSKTDRRRLLQALQGLGVEHVEQGRDREILVNAENRALIQDLLAKVMVEQRLNSTAE